MNIDLTPIVQAVITLIAAIITTKLIPWIKAKTTVEQQNMIRAAVVTLVFAAEQIYGAGRGSEKLEYVKAKLIEKGYDVDVDEIEAVIKEYTDALHAVKAAPTE